MKQKLYTEKTKQNKSKKQISIPLFMPFILITFSIMIAINVYNLISTVMANSEENICETNTQNNLETVEVAETNEEIISNATITDAIEETEETNTTSDTNTITYTASNGQQYSVIGTLNIPSLGIEYTILSQTSTELLKISLNKYWGADPNEVGNMVVVGHNYRNTKFFSKLPNIKIGEIVKITDLSGRTLDYKVYDTYVIDPYDNACTSQLTDGHTEITLITCYNNGNDRFVAKARAY